MLVQEGRHATPRAVHGSDGSEATFIIQDNHHHNHGSRVLQNRLQCDGLYLNDGVSVPPRHRHQRGSGNGMLQHHFPRCDRGPHQLVVCSPSRPGRMLWSPVEPTTCRVACVCVWESRRQQRIGHVRCCRARTPCRRCRAHDGGGSCCSSSLTNPAAVAARAHALRPPAGRKVGVWRSGMGVL